MATHASIPKGTRDFLPEVVLRREHIFNTIRSVFKKYGYAPIETPAMEKLAVLTGKYGEEGDRLIFKILNSGDFLRKAKDLDDARKLTPQIAEKALRYDLTVPFARFVVMHQNELTFPFKRYQIQPVWRADRPQKGRYREFYQCDADVVGSDSLLFEAEFMSIFDEVLSGLGFTDFTILLNHRKLLSAYAEAIGHPELFVTICVAIDKLDKIGESGVRKELDKTSLSPAAIDQLFLLISDEINALPYLQKLDLLAEKLGATASGPTGISELRQVFSMYQSMSHFQGKVLLDLRLARGLNYYTGTIFEVQVNNVNIGSICGGGRYADLTGVFGKPGLSGVGISFGADRIYDAMGELGLFEEIPQQSVQVLLINFGEESQTASLQMLSQLRSHGIAAELYPDDVKLKKQFGYADKKNIPFALMIGSEEIATQTVQLKDLHSGNQESLTHPQVLERLRTEL